MACTQIAENDIGYEETGEYRLPKAGELFIYGPCRSIMRADRDYKFRPETIARKKVALVEIIPCVWIPTKVIIKGIEITENEATAIVNKLQRAGY